MKRCTQYLVEPMGSTALPKPPVSVAALMARADALAGFTLGALARRHVVHVPTDLRRAKGWPGQLLEIALGASAGSRALPDFPHLGVEMKTIPMTPTGRALESTYVCTAPSNPAAWASWETAWPRKKLSRVLWVPLLGSGSPAARTIGAPVLWSPDADEDAAMRADWEDFAALAALGELGQITARAGKVLQLRPKAAKASQARWEVDADGSWVKQTPRGFYLRASFTGAVLRRHLLCSE